MSEPMCPEVFPNSLVEKMLMAFGQALGAEVSAPATLGKITCTFTGERLNAAMTAALAVTHAEELQAMLGHVLEKHRLPSGDSTADLSGTLDQVEALLGKLDGKP